MINRIRKRKSSESLVAVLFITAAFLWTVSGCGEQSQPPAQQKAETAKKAPEKKPGAVATVAHEKKAPLATAGYHYDPMGKIDPFLPLVREVEGMDEQILSQGPLTPLQRYTLSELKLVAVIVAGEQSKAMVEDSKGDGYILSKGTLIGNKHGEVAEIRDNEVVIVEKEINPSTGGVVKKEVALVLHKSEEEEL